jgi:hypothetical protein
LSELFFDRMRRELFALFVEARREKAQHELDEEVERITGKECDDAARSLSKADFKKVAEEAMQNIKKRKKGAEKDESQATKVIAYA